MFRSEREIAEGIARNARERFNMRTQAIEVPDGFVITEVYPTVEEAVKVANDDGKKFDQYRFVIPAQDGFISVSGQMLNVHFGKFDEDALYIYRP